MIHKKDLNMNKNLICNNKNFKLRIKKIKNKKSFTYKNQEKVFR